VKVIVSIAYEVGPTNTKLLEEFVTELVDIGAIPKLYPVDPASTCDCVTQALWLRNLAYHLPEMMSEDLMMISESDVLITTSEIIKPLSGDFRAWVFWSEPALYGGQTFAMSFTTMSKEDWSLVLLNSSTCEEALTKFSDVTKVLTIGDWTADFYGKNWESDQNVVTAQLVRLGICSAPRKYATNKAYSTFMNTFNTSSLKINDAKTCYKGQGYGECRSYNLGNTWYGEIGGCTWYHHWYPLELLLSIVKHNKEEDFMGVFDDHLIHNENLERLFFDHEMPYF